MTRPASNWEAGVGKAPMHENAGSRHCRALAPGAVCGSPSSGKSANFRLLASINPPELVGFAQMGVASATSARARRCAVDPERRRARAPPTARSSQSGCPRRGSRPDRPGYRRYRQTHCRIPERLRSPQRLLAPSSFRSFGACAFASNWSGPSPPFNDQPQPAVLLSVRCVMGRGLFPTFRIKPRIRRKPPGQHLKTRRCRRLASNMTVSGAMR